jgi:hypothetical protein
MPEFPQEIEVTLTLKVRVTDQESRDYWLNPQTGEPSIGMIADVNDALFSWNEENNMVSINNLTEAQIQQILNNEAAL